MITCKIWSQCWSISVEYYWDIKTFLPFYGDGYLENNQCYYMKYKQQIISFYGYYHRLKTTTKVIKQHIIYKIRPENKWALFNIAFTFFHIVLCIIEILLNENYEFWYALLIKFFPSISPSKVNFTNITAAKFQCNVSTEKLH